MGMGNQHTATARILRDMRQAECRHVQRQWRQIAGLGCVRNQWTCADCGKVWETR